MKNTTYHVRWEVKSYESVPFGWTWLNREHVTTNLKLARQKVAELKREAAILNGGSANVRRVALFKTTKIV